jgi:hypothetical protein
VAEFTEQPIDDKVIDLDVKCLTAVADGRKDEAQDFADRAADSGSVLGVALSTYLRSSHRHGVYDQPAAFEAFISGGGNIHLYGRASTVLAAAYPGVASLLDIGCGNGRALVPALQMAGSAAPGAVELVEPGADLLEHCVGSIQSAGLPVQITGWQMGLTAFLEAAPRAGRWQLAQSTFALQSIEPAERLLALRTLAPLVDRLIVIDFDVAAERPRSRSHIRGLAARYERGLAEYDETRDLVAQGFLMPVLVGQLSPDIPRTNWEHTSAYWASHVADAGFGNIEVTALADYWSAPAFVLTANSTGIA